MEIFLDIQKRLDFQLMISSSGLCDRRVVEEAVIVTKCALAKAVAMLKINVLVLVSLSYLG